MSTDLEQLSPETIAQLLRRSLTTQPYALASVTSGSMRPLFEVGDQIGLTAVSVAQLQKGDIVTFETEQGLFTHRLYAISASFLFTRGDRSVAFDPPISHDQLIGLVVMRRRQDDILDLRQGNGRALNETLSSIAMNEARHFARVYWRWRPVRVCLHGMYILLARRLIRRFNG